MRPLCKTSNLNWHSTCQTWILFRIELDRVRVFWARAELDLLHLCLFKVKLYSYLRHIYTSGFRMHFLHCVAIFYYLPWLSKTKVIYKKLQQNSVNCGNWMCKLSFTSILGSSIASVLYVDIINFKECKAKQNLDWALRNYARSSSNMRSVSPLLSYLNILFIPFKILNKGGCGRKIIENF